MWPALLTIWAVTKTVQYDHVCCQGGEKLFHCLPKPNPIESRDIELMSINMMTSPDPRNLLNQEAKVHDLRADLSLEDTSVREAIEREEREDHFSQYLPEAMINTDNEITGLESLYLEEDIPLQ